MSEINMANLLIDGEQPTSAQTFRKWGIQCIESTVSQSDTGWHPHTSVKNGEYRVVGRKLFFRAHADGLSSEDAEMLVRARIRTMIDQYEARLRTT